MGHFVLIILANETIIIAITRQSLVEFVYKDSTVHIHIRLQLLTTFIDRTRQ